MSYPRTMNPDIRKPLATLALLLALAAVSVPASAAEHVDLLIRNGMIYDGRGGRPYAGDLAVSAGVVRAVGKLSGYTAERNVDAGGLAVAPGFINMLSWAPDSLIYDGRGMSDIKQGVTLEVFGEGDSYGPLSAAIKTQMRNTQTD